MHYTCYKHPDRIAVAKIEMKTLETTFQDVKQITMKSPVCQECADGARSARTPLFPLNEE